MVSIIVPTYNGKEKLPILFNALKTQSFSDFELIVVIDGSTDGTADWIEKVETKFTKVIIKQTNEGRAASRNTGAKAAHTDLFIFYDDDMEPNPKSVSRHLEFHKANQGILTGNQEEFLSISKTDIQNYKAHLSHLWTKKYNQGVNQLRYSNLFFTAANCSFKKSDFDRLGGFNSTLTDAEDYELAWRALKLGVNVYFDKDNHALHNDLISCRSYIKRQKEYKRARIKLFELHPDMIDSTSTELSVYKRITYAILSWRLFPFLVDSFNIFLLLPRTIRYKVYSAMIHAQSGI